MRVGRGAMRLSQMAHLTPQGMDEGRTSSMTRGDPPKRIFLGYRRRPKWQALPVRR